MTEDLRRRGVWETPRHPQVLTPRSLGGGLTRRSLDSSAYEQRRSAATIGIYLRDAAAGRTPRKWGSHAGPIRALCGDGQQARLSIERDQRGIVPIARIIFGATKAR